jgi:hypothetical protein
MSQMSQQGYEKLVSISHILYNADRVTSDPNHRVFDAAPYDSLEMNLGDFPVNQQLYNPVAVTSLLNPSRSEMELYPKKTKPIPSAEDPLQMLHTHDLDVLFDQDNEKNPYQEEQDELARIEQAKQARLAREQAAREEEERRQREEAKRMEQWFIDYTPGGPWPPIEPLIWGNSNNSGVQFDMGKVEDWGTHDTEKVKEDANEGMIPQSNDLGALRNLSKYCF